MWVWVRLQTNTSKIPRRRDNLTLFFWTKLLNKKTEKKKKGQKNENPTTDENPN